MDNPINYWYQKYLTLKAKVDDMMKDAVEVDLEKEIERYGKKSMWLILGEEGISKCARHFYELGKNSK